MNPDDVKWAGRLLELAQYVQTWSKGPEAMKNVGAAIASPDFRQLGFGYSGPPAGFDDEAWVAMPKEQRVALTAHAELNAILNAGRSLLGWSMAVSRFPCLECAKAIVQAGISTVISVQPGDSSWLGSQVKAHDLFTRMGVRVVILESTREGHRASQFNPAGTTL